MADTETEAGGSFIMNNRGHASHSAQVASEQERFISEETSTTEVMVRPKLLYPKYYKNLITENPTFQGGVFLFLCTKQIRFSVDCMIGNKTFNHT